MICSRKSYILTVVDSTSSNKLNAGNSTERDIIPNAAERRKNGTHSFIIRSPAMRNGLKTVVKRYTDSSENEDTEAMFPVPKNPTLMRKRKTAAVHRSFVLRARK